MRTTIHFEGLPGSGKTTASERFCRLLRNNGIDANWCLEEAPNHPIMSKESRALFRHHDFPQLCLNAWQNFLTSSNNTIVFDGYALQSTVRFLYSNCIARTQIEDYFKKWQELAPQTTLVYFPVGNPEAHFDTVFTERGEEWSSKLYNYVEHTPIGLANGLRNKAGFVEFWTNYQQLCYELLDAANISVHRIGSRSWNDNDLQILAAQAGFLPDRV